MKPQIYVDIFNKSIVFYKNYKNYNFIYLHHSCFELRAHIVAQELLDTFGQRNFVFRATQTAAFNQLNHTPHFEQNALDWNIVTYGTIPLVNFVNAFGVAIIHIENLLKLKIPFDQGIPKMFKK